MIPHKVPQKVTMGYMRGSQKGTSRGTEGVGGEAPPPRGSKSYTTVKTLNPQKIFDFENMKNFLKGDGLEKFSKSTTRSR